MSDIDLTAAIEAGSISVWGTTTRDATVLAKMVLEAALPDIREALAKQIEDARFARHGGAPTCQLVGADQVDDEALADAARIVRGDKS